MAKYTDAQKLAYCKAYQTSGLARNRFCDEHKLTGSVFKTWYDRYLKNEPLTTSGGKKHRSEEEWDAIIAYAVERGAVEAGERFGISDASVYSRRDSMRKRGQDPGEFAKPNPGRVKPGPKKAKKAVAKKTSNGLARRKQEQTNLIPVVEHEPVTTPRFEDAQLQPLHATDGNDAWDKLNAILVKHLPPSERLQVFGLIHAISES